MERKRYGRKAISNMIGGIIVLTLTLSALATMVFLLKEYDAYQNTLNTMSQADVDRFSEDVTPVFPGIILNTSAISCQSGSCNQGIMTLSNNGPVAVQLARIYMNSTHTFCAASKPLCILDPSNVTTPFKFDSNAALIDTGDTNHALRFWLPTDTQLSTSSIILVTTRGRIFTFQWPFPSGVAIPAELRKDTGPFRLVYDNNLVTVTDSGHSTPGQLGCANTYPSNVPCYSNGWVSYLSGGGGTVFYVRLSNIGGAPITLLDTSYILAEGCQKTACSRFNGTATATDVEEFYIVAPMSLPCYSSYFASSGLSADEYLSWPRSGNCQTPSTLQPYNFTYQAGLCNLNNPCYELPNATFGIGGLQATNYVLFGAAGSKDSLFATTPSSLKSGYEYFLYLELSYIYYVPNPSVGVYNGNYPTIPYECYTGAPMNWCYTYEYTISIPLIAIST